MFKLASIICAPILDARDTSVSKGSLVKKSLRREFIEVEGLESRALKPPQLSKEKNKKAHQPTPDKPKSIGGKFKKSLPKPKLHGSDDLHKAMTT